MKKKQKPEFKVTDDNHMNPELKKEIQDLRGLMWSNTPKITNQRFVISQDAEKPAIHIMDTETKKISRISLCDYWGAVKVLNDFFPPEK